MNSDILVVQNLKKSYGSQQVVNGLSFSVCKGEVFGLLGPNGAGKSTTISMLSGLIKPDSGQIKVLGMDITQHSNFVKARIGLVPQDLALYQTISARDNLLFFGRIYGLHGKKLRQRVETILEMVQLSNRANDPVKTFSGGMKRRINLAVGLLHEPEILFLDEPTVGVDVQSRNAIFESIEMLNRMGLTILYTTHYMEEAQRLCCRVAIIDHGQMIALDTPANLVRTIGGGLIRAQIDQEKAALAAALLEQSASVQSVRVQDSQLDIRTCESQKVLTSLFDIAHQHNTRVNALQIFEPNLETVFLSLTGKNLRE